MIRPIVTPLHPAPDPLDLFERLRHLPNPILLQSHSDHADLGRYSFLCADPVDMVVGNAADWPRVRDQLRSVIDPGRTVLPGLPPFQGGWAGWFSYELGAAFDDMPRAARDEMGIPDVVMGLHDWVIAWDHQTQQAWMISTGITADHQIDRARALVRLEQVLGWINDVATADHPMPHPSTVGVTGDFSAEEYQSAVARVIEYILAGDIFQANLSQRFVAPFDGSPVSLYRDLIHRTQPPMAALLVHGDTAIVSASPERFLRYDPSTRQVETRPIKGTVKRSRGAAGDAEEVAELLASEKDHAENVMIVDLLRNDLSKVCVPGSVRVPSLCQVVSYPTVHHLVSTVTGAVVDGNDALDLLAATFPGGSITGAPKLRAMEIIAELEPVTRGVYCGAIGWIGLDGAMDTSIAIRTITCVNGNAVINAGGGITARSNPIAEYQETLDKAAALIAAVADTQ